MNAASNEDVRCLTSKLYWIDSLIGGCIDELADIRSLAEKLDCPELTTAIEQYEDSLQFAYEAFPDNDEILNIING